MPETLIQKLIKIAWAHGFDAFYDDAAGTVICAIPAMHVETRQRTMELFPCVDLDSLRIVLGY